MRDTCHSYLFLYPVYCIQIADNNGWIIIVPITGNGLCTIAIELIDISKKNQLPALMESPGPIRSLPDAPHFINVINHDNNANNSCGNFSIFRIDDVSAGTFVGFDLSR